MRLSPFSGSTTRIRSGFLVGIVGLLAGVLVSAQDATPKSADPPGGTPGNGAAALPAAYEETLPGTKLTFRMVPIPPAGGKPGYWMSECEITWEVFDAFVFGIDGAREREGDSVDAYTRPSKPYIPPDRGFGHDGYPVISASYRNAKQFCRWLTARTGHEYRLPTVEEWRHAAAAGSTGRYAHGDDAAKLGEYAWYDENADWTTHPVGEKEPNAWGLRNVHGNAGEWCLEVKDGRRKAVLCGGTFQGTADEVTLTSIERPDDSWQMTDPQIPKSRWWLSDAPFAGLRVLRPFPPARSPEPETGGSGSERDGATEKSNGTEKEDR